MTLKRFSSILFIVAALLLVPFVAMQFTAEVNWTSSDFVIAAILLLGFGLLIDLAVRKIPRTRTRLLVVGIILFVLFIIWGELAVGIFGTPFAGS